MKSMYKRYKRRRDELADRVEKSNVAMMALWVVWLTAFSLLVGLVVRGGWQLVISIVYVALLWLSLFLGTVISKWLVRMMIASAMATYDVMSKDGELPPPPTP